MIDQLEKEIHEGMLDLYQHQSMSRERESIVYFYFAGIHNENITLKEEIKRLKEEYVILQNASDEVEEEKDKEIERLNNIIKELEKYLEKIKDRVIMYGIDDDTYKTTNLYRDIKNKIKELKGSDKE